MGMCMNTTIVDMVDRRHGRHTPGGGRRGDTATTGDLSAIVRAPTYPAGRRIVGVVQEPKPEMSRAFK